MSKPAPKSVVLKKGSIIITVLILLLVIAGTGFLLLKLTKKNLGSLPQTQTNSKPALKVGIVQAAGSILYEIPDGFKAGLKDLGYEEGKNITYYYSDWNEDPSKVDALVKSNIDRGVDLIYAVGNPTVASALKQTNDSGKQIPIVFTIVEDPVANGVVKTLKSSGNNSTGIGSNTPLVVAKQLEFLKKINPNIKKVGFFGEGFHAPQGPGDVTAKTIKSEAPKLGFTLVEYTTKMPPGPQQIADFQKISGTIKPGDVDALIHVPGHFIPDLQNREIELAKKLKIITLEPILPEVLQGGLFSYNTDLFDMGEQSAIMADKIFKGAKPTDIPVEFPRKSILVVNLKTAKEIGFTIPNSVLELADKKLE